jgi:hypothetical protein
MQGNDSTQRKPHQVERTSQVKGLDQSANVLTERIQPVGYARFLGKTAAALIVSNNMVTRCQLLGKFTKTLECAAQLVD